MKVLEFNINSDLEKSFLKKTKDLGNRTIFKFHYVADYKKAYKQIASIIEDSWAVKNVTQSNSLIVIEADRRLKNKFKFPKTDTHFNREKDRYQFHTLLAALALVPEKKTAIDIGGHIGLYSSALLDSFSKVIAFEPSPTNIECFRKNASSAILHEMALGDSIGRIDLNMALDNTGNNSIVEEFGGNKISAKISTLDSFDLENINLIKIDVQGYEEQVLLGSKETILKNKPVLIVELITHKNSPPNEKAMAILSSYNYKVLSVMGKDYIMGPANF